jgi:hypothetical protein
MWFWQDFDETAGVAKFAFGGLELHVFELDGDVFVLWMMGITVWRASVGTA